jgi:hypothetical protein
MCTLPPARRFRPWCQPSMQVVVGADGLPVHTPVVWREGRGFNRCRSDVGDQPLHAIGTCPQSQLGKRCWYLAGRQERHCHQFSDQSVGSIILFISSCKSQLLNLQRRQIHQPKYVFVSKKPKKAIHFFLTIARLEH